MLWRGCVVLRSGKVVPGSVLHGVPLADSYCGLTFDEHAEAEEKLVERASEVIVRTHRCGDLEMNMTQADWDALRFDGVRGYRSARISVVTEYRTCLECGSTMGKTTMRRVA